LHKYVEDAKVAFLLYRILRVHAGKNLVILIGNLTVSIC